MYLDMKLMSSFHQNEILHHTKKVLVLFLYVQLVSFKQKDAVPDSGNEGQR